MDKRLEERLEDIEDKVDVSVEVSMKIAEALSKNASIDPNDIEGWKQRCRQRAATQRRRRR
jgi:hypothetical protein